MTEQLSPQAHVAVPTAAEKRPNFRPTTRPKLLRFAWVFVALLVAGGALWLRLRPKAVTVEAIARGTAVDAVYATATVEALDRVVVKSKVAGAILEMKVREGSVVRKGDLLAIIDSPSLKYQLARGKAEQIASRQLASTSSPQIAMTEAQAKAIEASLRNARQELARTQKLAASGSIAQADVDRAASQVAVQEAQLEALQAQVRTLRIDLTARSGASNASVSELAAHLSDAEVRAPIDGVVLTRLVEPGELVPPNGPLFKIGDVRNLLLECSVDEADIGRLAVGKKAAVSLYAFPKQTFRGEVVEILPDADRAKKSFLIRVRIEQAPAGLRTGMSAEVNVIVDEHPNVLLIPTEAIDATNEVWLVRDGRVQKRAIKIGVRDMLRAESLAGLEDGDQVVVAGFDQLEPGMRVKITVRSPAANEPKPKPGGGSL